MTEACKIAVSVDRLRGMTVRRRSDVSLDAVLSALKTEGQTLKASHKSTTRRVNDWVVKSSGREAGLGLLKRTFRRTRYRRGWDAVVHLAEHGIGAPQPIAFVEATRLVGLVTSNAFLCEYIDGACDVEAYADRYLVGQAEPEDIHAYLKRIADAVNALAASGAYHADLAGKNILTRDGVSFFFIDLDSVALGCRYTKDLRMKNHVQLYDSFCDRWDDGFLEPFLARMLPDTDGLPNWMKKVRELQSIRRARTEAAWRRHGRESNRC
ncbi:MAG: hypothetical protein GY851_28040 [bacterium]|nr:hypothetical protein [bacterium]